MRNFEIDEQQGVVYYGNSDFLAQIADHIQRYPDSCLTINILAFYNSLYSELSDPTSCEYQVQINEELCPDPEFDNEGIIIDTLLDFLEGLPRRAARRAINRITRKVRRELIRRLGDNF